MLPSPYGLMDEMPIYVVSGQIGIQSRTRASSRLHEAPNFIHVFFLGLDPRTECLTAPQPNALGMVSSPPITSRPHARPLCSFRNNRRSHRFRRAKVNASGVPFLLYRESKRPTFEEHVVMSSDFEMSSPCRFQPSLNCFRADF